MYAGIECFEFKCHGKAIFWSYSSFRPVVGNVQQIPYAIHPLSFVYSKQTPFQASRLSLSFFFFFLMYLAVCTFTI